MWPSDLIYIQTNLHLLLLFGFDKQLRRKQKTQTTRSSGDEKIENQPQQAACKNVASEARLIWELYWNSNHVRSVGHADDTFANFVQSNLWEKVKSPSESGFWCRCQYLNWKNAKASKVWISLWKHLQLLPSVCIPETLLQDRHQSDQNENDEKTSQLNFKPCSATWNLFSPATRCERPKIFN